MTAKTQPIVSGLLIMRRENIAFFLMDAKAFQQIVQTVCLEKFLVQVVIINVTCLECVK